MENAITREKSNLQIARTNLSQAQQNNASSTEIESLRNRVNVLETKVADLERQLAQARNRVAQQPVVENPNNPSTGQLQAQGWIDKQGMLKILERRLDLSPELASIWLQTASSFSLEETEYEWPEGLNKTIPGTGGSYIGSGNLGDRPGHADRKQSRVRTRTFTKLPSEIIIRVGDNEYRPSQASYREMQYRLNEICEGNVNCNMKALTRQDTFSSRFDTWENAHVLTNTFYFHSLYWGEQRREQQRPSPLQDLTGTATFSASFQDSSFGSSDSSVFRIQEPSFNETGFSFGRIKYLPGGEITLAADFSRNTIRGNIIFNQGVGRINLQETTIRESERYIGHANGIVDGENYSGNYHGYFNFLNRNGDLGAWSKLFLTNDSKTRYLDGSAYVRETE